MTDKTNKLTMYLVTKKELDLIKNDCAYPERLFCDGCEYADGEDNTRASGLGCNFEGANAVMDRVLSRPVPSAPTDEQCRICSEAIRKDEREKVIKEIIGLQHVCNLAEYRASHRVILTADVEEILESLRSSSEARE